MIVTLDFETHYSSDYSLSKMSEIDYIMHPRFELIMCAVKEGDGPSDVFVGEPAIRERLAKIDWSKAAMLAHNTRFDGAILAWRLGIKPALYLDTLSMARALTHAHTGKSSLKAVSDYLKLPPKGDEVVNALGKTLQCFLRGPLHELNAYIDYCKRDNDNCYEIFKRFMRVFPKRELAVIDMTLRMFIDPSVRLNSNVLAEHLNKVRADKLAVMARVAHIDKSIFSSNVKFTELLKSYGVEVPMKISPTTGEEIPALARGDRAFKELCNDEDLPDEVQALLMARINSKSTIEETRTEKLLALADRHRYLAVPLRYYGAHTGRFSGDGGINLQNLKRGSRIREAIEAPSGMRILHRDSSQIEARMVAFMAGCVSMLEAFEQGRDIYSEFATMFYGVRVTKKDTLQRFVGKTCILGLGYGMGYERFRHTLFIGNGGMSVSLEPEEAKKLVYFYRNAYRAIPRLWAHCHDNVAMMAQSRVPIYPSTFVRCYATTHVSNVFSFTTDGISLPNGLCIQYPRLRFERIGQMMTSQLVYDDPYGCNKKLFGGKIVENIAQALARIVITDAACRVYDQTKIWPFMTTHDSLDYCVSEKDAVWFDQLLEREFARRPEWGPNLPLASEGGFGRNLMIAENEKHPEHNQ